MFWKPIIRRAIALFLALVLLPAEVAIAEHSNMAALRYEEIEDWFTHATSIDTDYASALEDFRNITDSYEQNPEVQNEDRAFQYYCYAQGMLLFDEEDYTSAYNMLKGLDGLADAKGYASFAHGMILKEKGANQVSAYEDAMAEFKEAMKCDALGGAALLQLKECEALSKDSSSWQDYNNAITSISRADSFEHDGYISNAKNEIENAKKLLSPLVNMSFENSEELYEYCTVRSDELSGLIQQAIDGYSRVYNVLDSAERYHRLVNGDLLPTQAPDPNAESAVLTSFLYHADRNLIPYAGPGVSYREIEVLYITVDTDVWVCAIERGKSGTYYMSEADTEQGKIRFWAVDFRLDPVDMDMKFNLPEIGCNPRNVVVLEDEEALFGPGESYCNTGLIIPKGTKVTAFEEEGAYTMIEYALSEDDSLMRVWICTNNLI